MSDRSFTSFTPPAAWPWRLLRSASGVAHAPMAMPRRAGFGLPASGDAPWPGGSGRGGLAAMLHAAWRRQRTRRGLAELDAHGLKDIGVSYAEAEAEANKPFWVA